MAQEADAAQENRPQGRKRRIVRNAFRVVVALLAVAVLLAWFARYRIADDLIADAFRDAGVRATYDIESISPGRQVVANIVVGDPAQPDLTVERLELLTTPRFGLPDIRQLRVSGARLYGSWRGGQLSFGALDPLLFTGEDKPFRLPDVNLALADGRALIASDYGRIGLSLSGEGRLRDGFTGELAAVSDALAAGECAAERTTLYGTVSVDSERPHFTGPLRFDRFACPDSQIAMRDAAVQLDLTADARLTHVAADFAARTGGVELASARANGLTGGGEASWRDGVLTARYDLELGAVATPPARMDALALEGRLRASDDFARMETDGDLRGTGVAMGLDLDRTLGDVAEATRGTLLAPLLDRTGLNLARELRGGSSVTARYTLRRMDGATAIAIPEARLRGASGDTVLALSRGQIAPGAAGAPRLAGNFATGGDGLPRITGRMERAAGGALTMNLAMREYASGRSRLAIPRLSLKQDAGGGVTLDGEILASGPLPGGAVRGLVLPVDGRIAADGRLALWDGCRDVRFDRLAFSNLTLERQSLTLCPQPGVPILRYGANGLQLAAGATSLDLRGRLAETPIALRSGAVGFAWPGALVARDLDVALGPPATAQGFAIADLTANLSAPRLGGEFSGTDVFLASVPLDVTGARGTWSYADDRLGLSQAAFTLADRQEDARFEPLVARDAALTLAGNVIAADALLREPETDAAIARAAVVHDLGTGTGHADLTVDGVAFDANLQPLDLTHLALGVIANVRGTVSGEGRIDWTAQGLTSSGRFGSDSLDFAAAFGPVQGASGTVVFTDLLGLSTAPGQTLAVASVNPGIEVYDGTVAFQLRGGEVLAIEGGRWPFMGGTLIMRPVDITLGAEETRTYTMEIVGLEAARFIERTGIANIAATGTFDGVIPIVFDITGDGRLENGRLVSRPPGGHIAYVGDLTYADMSIYANYAFSALRDLQYDRMEIGMNGPLTGELVTQVRFAGIRQGPEAERNIVTRVLADLPIELRINIRAPFYGLINSLRSIQDPAAVRSPRDLGLVGADGRRLRDSVDQQTVDEQDEAAEAEAERQLRESLGEPAEKRPAPAGEDTGVQPPESEIMR
ncbi:intermembrane phospholipid transport protein YdbH family protein [Aurantiacibacter spongiae]|uniref:Exoprotein n=1 Tax=Aurantiacibacter spongiae TaxID=2488860 RepID=A0A3N5CNU7_9SPHN|nr:YdbH domain-containing protein [Aurantiacibacter spongiae]RPF70624.1 exoprotein [Aurantiacibacter spongiae]